MKIDQVLCGLVAMAMATAARGSALAATNFINDGEFAAAVDQATQEAAQGAKDIQPAAVSHPEPPVRGPQFFPCDDGKKEDSEQKAECRHFTLKQLMAYHDGVEWPANTTQIFRNALDYISKDSDIFQSLDQRKNGLFHKYPRMVKPWAVVLDVDETVLDNEEYEIDSNLVYSPSTWHIWVQKRAARAIPGAKEFLDGVRKLTGAHVVFITDRVKSEETDTIENMRALGLFQEGDLMLTKDPSMTPKDTKLIRRQCVERGIDSRCKAFGAMPILYTFGDSARDHVEYYGKDMRVQGVFDLLEGAGRKMWILPNPFYGQWGYDYN